MEATPEPSAHYLIASVEQAVTVNNNAAFVVYRRRCTGPRRQIKSLMKFDNIKPETRVSHGRSCQLNTPSITTLNSVQNERLRSAGVDAAAFTRFPSSINQ